jgi:hypothetical protein
MRIQPTTEIGGLALKMPNCLEATSHCPNDTPVTRPLTRETELHLQVGIR